MQNGPALTHYDHSGPLGEQWQVASTLLHRSRTAGHAKLVWSRKISLAQLIVPGHMSRPKVT